MPSRLSHAQLFCDPMDCSPPGSSVHGDSPGRNTGVGCHFLLQGIFLTQGLNPCLLHWQAGSLPLGATGEALYMTQITQKVFFSPLFSVLPTSWKELRRRTSRLASKTPLHHRLPLPRGSVYQPWFRPGTLWSTCLPRLSGLKWGLAGRRWLRPELRGRPLHCPCSWEDIIPVDDSRPQRHLHPLSRTRVRPTVREFFSQCWCSSAKPFKRKIILERFFKIPNVLKWDLWAAVFSKALTAQWRWAPRWQPSLAYILPVALPDWLCLSLCFGRLSCLLYVSLTEYNLKPEKSGPWAWSAGVPAFIGICWDSGKWWASVSWPSVSFKLLEGERG